MREFGVGLPPPEPFGTARPIVAKHERAHEMFYLDRVKPGFSRDLEGRARRAKHYITLPPIIGRNGYLLQSPKKHHFICRIVKEHGNHGVGA